MSYINKKGKTTAWRLMVIRQQASDVIAYNQIITTITKAKETQRHVEKLITWAKKNDLSARRRALGFLLPTKKADQKALVDKLFNNLNQKYKNRNGGYTRVLKLGTRAGDQSEQAILQLV